jgi:hypothetical protein
LTALHAVVDPDQYETVPSEVPACLVRTVGDMEAKYPGRAFDPKVVARDMDLSSPTRIWRKARLAWPAPGTSTRRLDLAVLAVERAECTEFMASAPQVRFFKPERKISCMGLGFPKWRQRPGSGEMLTELHPVTGEINPVLRLTDTMSNFVVRNGSPAIKSPNENPWGGLSGAVLFEDDTGLPVGIVSRWEESFDLSVLGVTLLAAQVEDSSPLWVCAKLTKPIRSISQVRLYATSNTRARELAYLLDRGEQITDLTTGLVPEQEEKLGKPDPDETKRKTKWSPAITIVMGRPRDGQADFLRRIERHLGASYSGRRFVYFGMPKLTLPRDNDVDRGERLLLADLAEKLTLTELTKALRSHVVVDIRIAVEQCNATLRDGIVSRAFDIELALDKVSPTAPDILLRFIARWAKFGSFDTPVILFLRIVTRDCDSQDIPDPLVAPFLSRLKDGISRISPAPAWIDLRPLADCLETDLEEWESELANESFEIPVNYLDDIRRYLRERLKREPDSFASSDFLFAIDSIRL